MGMVNHGDTESTEKSNQLSKHCGRCGSYDNYNCPGSICCLYFEICLAVLIAAVLVISGFLANQRSAERGYRISLRQLLILPTELALVIGLLMSNMRWINH